MDIVYLRSRLERGRDVLCAQIKGLPEDEYAWKPAADRWSILEVVNHLADEEILDFRTRFDLTLHRPGEAWPPIHPSAWVTERNYAGRDYEESVWRFCEERERSLDWLGTLADPDWTLGYDHPSGRRIRAGDLALSWIAHDLLHVRQIDRLLYERAQDLGRPFSPEYAGDW